MDRVLDRLWIGSSPDFGAPLRALGFAGVLDLRDGRAPIADPSITVFRLRNRDGDPWTPEQIHNALDFVAARVRIGNVLIACAAGMSRSACMTIGYLVRVGFSEADAFELVRNARAKILPVPNMLACVLEAVRK